MIIKIPLKSQIFDNFSLLMGKVIKNKSSLKPVTSHSSGYKTKFRKIPLSVIYYLTKFDNVIGSSFWVIAKIASANLCKSIHDIINYSTSICSFISEKCGEEGKKLQKIEYLENKKTCLDEIKGIFHSFQRAIIW